MYRQNARADYLALAKCRKRTGKRIRKAIKKQLQYVRRDLRYIDEYLAQGIEFDAGQLERIDVIRKVYEQHDYMYCNKTHTVPDRTEVERAFSLAKRSFGLGLITTRLENTTRSSIVLSIIAMNVNRLTRLSFMRFLLSFFQGSNLGLSLEPTF